MSVQAGVWNFDGRPVDRGVVATISESLKQQGPDGEFSSIDGSIALLYRPFHTTAESRREKQPYVSRRGFILTWDGRLDNREDLVLDLRSDLELGSTDVAIVAAAFDRWETDCFRHIVGDWAVSIWKPKQHELIFAIDYMAVRHIFYYLRRSGIWWSTDLASLVSLSGDKFHIDDDYIAGYLAHDPAAHLTPYREISEVEPGKFVTVRNDGGSIGRFWRFNPKSQIRYATDTEYEEHFRHLFRQSVRRRLRSDSPIIAELSGGLDSSSIVCMADDLIAKEGTPVARLDTLSYYDKTEPHGDDWIYFQKVEEKRGRVGLHIDGSKLEISPASLGCSSFCPLPGALDLGKELENERASLMKSGGYRVILSGIGGDEFMGGIPDPRAHLADLLVQFKLVSLAKQLVAWSLVKRRPWIHLLWQSAATVLPASVRQFLLKEARVESWIRRDFAKRTRLSYRQFDVDESFGVWLPTRRGYIAGVVLMACKAAKFSLRPFASEEARYPYLDQNLIEFVLSIPASQLLRPGERRSLMRRSLVGTVPLEILSRRTKQFGARTPLIALERNVEQLQMAFDSPLSASLGYIESARFVEEWNAARNGNETCVVRLLKTIALEFWLRDLAARHLIELETTSTLPGAKLPIQRRAREFRQTGFPSSLPEEWWKN